MAKKPRSPAQLAADARRSEAMKANAQADKIETSPPAVPQEQDFGTLLKQIAELKDNPLVQALFTQELKTAPGGRQATNKGLIGTFERFSVDPGDYPDPTERLAVEPVFLSRGVAFANNFELKYEVGISEYPTIDGGRNREPKFSLKLIKIVMDPETYEPTNRRYVVCQMIFFEDPDTALTIAREQGLEVDKSNELVFLNEMRYIRMRDWLLEAFFPPPPPKAERKNEQVIGNKLVEVYEVSSEDPLNIEQIKSRL